MAGKFKKRNADKSSNFWDEATGKRTVKATGNVDGLLSTMSDGKGSTRSSSGSRSTPRPRPITNTSTSGTSNNAEYPDIIAWATRKGIKIIYDEFGKPVLSEYVIDKYMETFGNAYKVVGWDGKIYYFDKSTNKPIERGTAAAAKASSAAIVAGISFLFSSYLENGSIESKDYYNAAAQAGIEGAHAYVNTNFDWAQSNMGSAGVSAGFAGLGSAASQYINTGEIDAGQVAGDVAKAGVSKLVGNAILSNGGSASAAGAGASIWAGIIQAGLDLRKQGRVNKSTEWAMIGGAMAGPIGGMGGAVLAKAIGADAPTIKKHYTYNSDQGEDGIYYDKKTGQFKLSTPTDLTYKVDNNYIELTPGQKNSLLKKRQQEMKQQVQILVQDLADFDNMGAVEQLKLEERLNKYSRISVQTEEEYKAEYEKYKKNQDLYENSRMDNDGYSGEMRLSYDEWKKQYDERRFTDERLGRMYEPASDYGGGKRFADPQGWDRPSSMRRFANATGFRKEGQGKRFDPLLGWVHDDTSGDGTDDNMMQDRKYALEMLQAKKDRGEELTPRQLEALESQPGYKKFTGPAGFKGLLANQHSTEEQSVVPARSFTLPSTTSPTPPTSPTPLPTDNPDPIAQWLRLFNKTGQPETEETPT